MPPKKAKANPNHLTHIGPDVYAAERILEQRFNCETSKMEYFIKWRGFPDSHNSWEPKENLLDKRLLTNWKSTKEAATVQQPSTSRDSTSQNTSTSGTVTANWRTTRKPAANAKPSLLSMTLRERNPTNAGNQQQAKVSSKATSQILREEGSFVAAKARPSTKRPQKQASSFSARSKASTSQASLSPVVSSFASVGNQNKIAHHSIASTSADFNYLQSCPSTSAAARAASEPFSNQSQAMQSPAERVLPPLPEGEIVTMVDVDGDIVKFVEKHRQ